jgi:hypothetical protein
VVIQVDSNGGGIFPNLCNCDSGQTTQIETHQEYTQVDDQSINDTQDTQDVVDPPQPPTKPDDLNFLDPNYNDINVQDFNYDNIDNNTDNTDVWTYCFGA